MQQTEKLLLAHLEKNIVLPSCGLMFILYMTSKGSSSLSTLSSATARSHRSTSLPPSPSFSSTHILVASSSVSKTTEATRIRNVWPGSTASRPPPRPPPRTGATGLATMMQCESNRPLLMLLWRPPPWSCWWLSSYGKGFQICPFQQKLFPFLNLSCSYSAVLSVTRSRRMPKKSVAHHS